MEAHYLITNPKKGTWGRGETIAEAIMNSRFSVSQDRVHVFLVDPDAQANASGNPTGKFAVFIGAGKVRSDLRRVAMELGGPAARVSSRDTLVVDRILNALEESEVWSCDTVDEIADVLRHTGYPVNGPGAQAMEDD